MGGLGLRELIGSGDSGGWRVVHGNVDCWVEASPQLGIYCWWTLSAFCAFLLPEYGMGRDVSTSGDVYSYGILLLELFTGKRPTDDMFKGGLNIHKFAEMSLPERVMEIVDHKLLEDEEGASENSTTNFGRGKTHDCLILILKLGVACSEESPSERVTIGDLARELHLIKEMLVGRRTGIDLH
ncbi:hypothetical protein Vadar_027343 [Vaccinium darrowii]|uniref:Uncharacterized protein n=1 Tax=Vaccinium darrowii TaxID=229202 RepID=A0ACB7ZLP7_9ERIC|nr:hypothetical protein Vadar_027343 [Vaccinium darrowii]